MGIRSLAKTQGNYRLLEFDASRIPTPNPSPDLANNLLNFAIPAERVFPGVLSWQPAFDRQNRMVVGYNAYQGLYPPPTPVFTPLPGTPTIAPTNVAEYSGYFPGVYNNSLLLTPIPTSSPSLALR